MKKYIILILTIFLSFTKVYANELINMGYNYIDDTSNYYYDKDDYILNYGEWAEFNDEELENMEIKTFYKYNKVLPIRYIHIYNGGIGIDELKISELKIYNGLEEIIYEKECTSCSFDTLDYLNDNTYEFDKQYIMRYRFGYLVIDLLDEYEIKDLNIKIYLNDETSYLKKYNIGFSTTKERNEFITTKYFEEDFYSYRKNVLYEYKVDDKWDINYEYVEEYESDQYIDDNLFNKKISEQQKYRLYDLKYKTYMIKDYDENKDNNAQENIIEPIETKSSISISDIKQDENNLTNESNIQTKNTKKENTVKVIDTNSFQSINNYKTIVNKSNNKIFVIIYILIIIKILIIIILLNVKKMSYKK